MRKLIGAELLESLLNRQGPSGTFQSDEREQAVRDIIADVYDRGDAALYDCTAKFDGVTLEKLEIGKDEIEEAVTGIDPALRSAIELAAARIAAYHKTQAEAMLRDSRKEGLGWKVRPLQRVGIVVPGQAAPLPSTVLMTVLPAKAAGVEEIIIVTPPQKNGKVNPATLAAAGITGVNRVYSVGGAQAIAALAFGTQSVPAVDKICGPGNVYVTLAKKLLYGTVGIDGLAGPSEVVIVADGTADPAYCAADLLAQAEHTAGSAILLTDSPALIDRVEAALEEQLAMLENNEATRKNLDEFGVIGLLGNIAQAIGITNLYAPEHLLLLVENPEMWLEKITTAGCVITGKKGTVALGDYIAGPSHVLPTGGTARFSSPLNVTDFVKITSIVDTDKFELSDIAEAGRIIAEAEGLDAHAKALKMRQDR